MNKKTVGIVLVITVVEQVSEQGPRWLGGPPRLAAGQLSEGRSKAGLAVGSAPQQFPAVRLAIQGKLAPVGIAVALMACGPQDFLSGQRWAACRYEKTGGRVSASCCSLSSAAVLRVLVCVLLDSKRPFLCSDGAYMTSNSVFKVHIHTIIIAYFYK